MKYENIYFSKSVQNSANSSMAGLGGNTRRKNAFNRLSALNVKKVKHKHSYITAHFRMLYFSIGIDLFIVIVKNME